MRDFVTSRKSLGHATEDVGHRLPRLVVLVEERVPITVGVPLDGAFGVDTAASGLMRIAI